MAGVQSGVVSEFRQKALRGVGVHELQTFTFQVISLRTKLLTSD